MQIPGGARRVVMDEIDTCVNTLGRIGLKFDVFELMVYEILVNVMYIHNSHLVYNFYEQAIKLFL